MQVVEGYYQLEMLLMLVPIVHQSTLLVPLPKVHQILVLLHLIPMEPPLVFLQAGVVPLFPQLLLVLLQFLKVSQLSFQFRHQLLVLLVILELVPLSFLPQVDPYSPQVVTFKDFPHQNPLQTNQPVPALPEVLAQEQPLPSPLQVSFHIYL